MTALEWILYVGCWTAALLGGLCLLMWPPCIVLMVRARTQAEFSKWMEQGRACGEGVLLGLVAAAVIVLWGKM